MIKYKRQFYSFRLHAAFLKLKFVWLVYFSLLITYSRLSFCHVRFGLIITVACDVLMLH